MSGKTPAPAQDFDDQKARRSIVSAQGTGQGGAAPVNAPGVSSIRPQTQPHVDPIDTRSMWERGAHLAWKRTFASSKPKGTAKVEDPKKMDRQEGAALKSNAAKSIDKKHGSWWGGPSVSAVLEQPKNAATRSNEDSENAMADATHSGGTMQYLASPYKEEKDKESIQDKLKLGAAKTLGSDAEVAKLKDERTDRIKKKGGKDMVVRSRPMHDHQARSLARMEKAHKAGQDASDRGLEQNVDANGGRTLASRFSSAINGQDANRELMVRYNHFNSVAGPSDGAQAAHDRHSWHRKKDGIWATHGLDQDPTTHQHSNLEGKTAQAAVAMGGVASVAGSGLEGVGNGAYRAIKFGENIPRALYNGARRFVSRAERGQEKADAAIEATSDLQNNVETRLGTVQDSTGINTSPVSETTGMAAGYTSQALQSASEAFGSAADMAGSFVPGLATIVGSVDAAKNLANLSSASGIRMRSAGMSMKKNYKEAADTQATHEKLDRLYSPAGAADLIHLREQLGKELKSNVAPVESYASSDVKTQGAVVSEGLGTRKPTFAETDENRRYLKRQGKAPRNAGQSTSGATSGNAAPNQEKFDPTSGPQTVPGLVPAMLEEEHDRHKSTLSDKDVQHYSASVKEPAKLRDLGFSGKRVTGSVPLDGGRTPEEEAARKARTEEFHADLATRGAGVTEGYGKVKPAPDEVVEAARHEESQKKDVWGGKKPVRDVKHDALPSSASDPGSKEDAWTHGYQKKSDGKWSPSPDRDARKPVNHDDKKGNEALTMHETAIKAQGYAKDLGGRSGDRNHEMYEKAIALRAAGKHEEADSLLAEMQGHTVAALGSFGLKTFGDTVSLGMATPGANLVSKFGDLGSGLAKNYTKQDAEKQQMINTHEKNMSEEAMLKQRGHHDKAFDLIPEKYKEMSSKRLLNAQTGLARRNIDPFDRPGFDPDRSAGSERSKLPDVVDLRPNVAPALNLQEVEAPKFTTSNVESPKIALPQIPIPTTETVSPLLAPTLHKPKLDLAQVRAAGNKSTAEQAAKHHDPTSQVSEQTKQEYTSADRNQYSWKTMKTSGQRIRRSVQNAWKRSKMRERIANIKGFFGR